VGKWSLLQFGRSSSHSCAGNYSQATGVNDYGTSVGFSAVSATSYHAVIFERGKIIDLGSSGPLKGLSSTAVGINNAGQVVGSLQFDDGSGGFIYKPFIYQNGKVRVLNNPLFEGNSSLAGFNQWGLIAGTTGSGLGRHAFSYLGGKYTKLSPGGAAGSLFSYGAQSTTADGLPETSLSARPIIGARAFFLSNVGKFATSVYSFNFRSWRV
jgi:probable HAF family extracellular repeat protein